jgi:hypothetical protein
MLKKIKKARSMTKTGNIFLLVNLLFSFIPTSSLVIPIPFLCHSPSLLLSSPLPLEGEGLPCVVEEITAQGKGEGDLWKMGTGYFFDFKKVPVVHAQ